MQEPNPTEPANYSGSYTTARKEIVAIEITMYQSAGTLIIIIDFIPCQYEGSLFPVFPLFFVY
jgi:hypothetical protein